jgi:hypothetical protein
MTPRVPLRACSWPVFWRARGRLDPERFVVKSYGTLSDGMRAMRAFRVVRSIKAVAFGAQKQAAFTRSA